MDCMVSSTACGWWGCSVQWWWAESFPTVPQDDKGSNHIHCIGLWQYSSSLDVSFYGRSLWYVFIYNWHCSTTYWWKSRWWYGFVTFIDDPYEQRYRHINTLKVEHHALVQVIEVNKHLFLSPNANTTFLSLRWGWLFQGSTLTPCCVLLFNVSTTIGYQHPYYGCDIMQTTAFYHLHMLLLNNANPNCTFDDSISRQTIVNESCSMPHATIELAVNVITWLPKSKQHFKWIWTWTQMRHLCYKRV